MKRVTIFETQRSSYIISIRKINISACTSNSFSPLTLLVGWYEVWFHQSVKFKILHYINLVPSRPYRRRQRSPWSTVSWSVDLTIVIAYLPAYLNSLSIDYSVSWMQPPECCVQWAGVHMCQTYCATVCIGYACNRGSSSNCAFWCIRHCTGWRQTTLESSLGLSARTMLAVFSGLRRTTYC